MRLASLFRPSALCSMPLFSISIVLLFQPAAFGFSFHHIPAPDLKLSGLGRLTFTGDFDAVSLYSYEGQSETPPVVDDSQSILTPLPNNQLISLSESDGYITATCTLGKEDGSSDSIFIGGNFTRLGGTEAIGIAQYNLNTSIVTPLPGLKGLVSALLCDRETSTVYVGGDFKHGNNSNAASWVDGKGWTDLPFQGFNGPVASIEKDDSGHIIFGGSFDSLGYTASPSPLPKRHEQIVNLQTAEITSDAISPLNGFREPRNIICSGGKAEEGKTWLLDDYSPGFWRASMAFTFRPSKLRLYNTHLDGRGTKSFLFRASPVNGIMNLTYLDPDSGQDVSCDASCPLPSISKEEYRDFYFVDDVWMDGFMLEIQDWYGQGAGLNGIELFQNSISAYANNDFNEPPCANLETPSEASHTGPWALTQLGYLTAQATEADVADVSITFKPDVKQPGNYSIRVFTPGCLSDGTCGSRGIVNVAAVVTTGVESAPPIETLIAQTNLHNKYDTIYFGYIDASSKSFRPRVSLAPQSGQGNITVVASRVEFDLISSHETEKLNGLYDYNLSDDNLGSNSKTSTVNKAGLQMHQPSSILSLVKHNGVMYAGGSFSGNDVRNIISIHENATAMPEGGLNSMVKAMTVLDKYLYVGGDFNNTANSGIEGLNHIAAYSFSSETWLALGAGVNGPVKAVISLPLNVSSDINETVVAVSGDFSQIEAFDNNPPRTVSDFAVWIPSKRNWLQNLNLTHIQFTGQLSTSTMVNSTTILAGSLVSSGISVGAAVSLQYSNGLSLDPLFKTTDISSDDRGTFTGIYDTSADRNLTIVGGHFSVTATDGSIIENLAILDNPGGTATGLGKGIDSNSTFLAVAVLGDTLYAGGNVTGTVGGSTLNGYVAYNLSTGNFVQGQPPPLTGDYVFVNSIATRPKSTQVYFGGSFQAAGSLPCPSVCYYDTSDESWNRPGVSMMGVVLDLRWSSRNDMFAVGSLNIDGSDTAIATYNTKSQTWKAFKGATRSEIPGPVTAFTPASADISKFWLAGESVNGSSFLLEYDGSKFRSIGDIFGSGTKIRGLEVLPLSNDHKNSRFLKNDLALIITGRLALPAFGNASAALFNGTHLSPFLLSSTQSGQPGSMAQIITEKRNPYSSEKGHHSNGIIILISFCLALGCIFLIVIVGVILNKIQRRRQGYMSAPRTYGTDRAPSMRRLPPEYLFNSLRGPGPGVPTI